MALFCAMRVLLFAGLLVNAFGLELEENRVVARATKPFCKTVKSIVTAANQESAATAFCSSYLQIPESTRTSTTTTVTVKTTTAAVQAVVSATVTSTISVAPTCGGPGGGFKMMRRDAHKAQSEPKPSCFSKYTASAVLSSACSCLKIPHGTTTITSTSTSTRTSTIGGGTSTSTITTTVTSPGAVQTPNQFRVYGSAGSPAAGEHLLMDFSNSGQGQGAFVVQPGDLFQLNQSGNLVSSGGGNTAYQHDPSAGNSEIVYFNAAVNIDQEGGYRLSCSIVPVVVGGGYGCALSCTQGGHTANTLTTNAGQLVWQLESPPGSGTPFTPMVEASQ